MGYDVTIQFASWEARDAMLEFLDEKVDIIKAICKASGEYHAPQLHDSRCLTYGQPHKFGVGMHCTVVTPAIASLFAWVASKSDFGYGHAGRVMWIDDMPMAISCDGHAPGAAIKVDERGVVMEKARGWRSRVGEKLLGLDRATIRDLLGELNDAWLTRAEQKAKPSLRRRPGLA